MISVLGSCIERTRSCDLGSYNESLRGAVFRWYCTAVAYRECQRWPLSDQEQVLSFSRLFLSIEKRRLDVRRHILSDLARIDLVVDAWQVDK